MNLSRKLPQPSVQIKQDVTSVGTFSFSECTFVAATQFLTFPWPMIKHFFVCGWSFLLFERARSISEANRLFKSQLPETNLSSIKRQRRMDRHFTKRRGKNDQGRHKAYLIRLIPWKLCPSPPGTRYTFFIGIYREMEPIIFITKTSTRFFFFLLFNARPTYFINFCIQFLSFLAQLMKKVHPDILKPWRSGVYR